MSTSLLSARRAGPLLFGSGLCALVYQTAWMREFRLVFGASTASTAAVLAVFTAGLGAGGLWLGPRADRSPRPWALYARLEAGIAVSAALSPLLIWLARLAYIHLGGSAALGSTGSTLLRLALSTLVLAVPTLLMGGTLPAAVAAVEIDEDVGRRRLAWLYGLNTLGAVAGCVLSTFYSLEALGTRGTLWAAAVLNMGVAGVAAFWARRIPAGHGADSAGPPAQPQAASAPSVFVLSAAALVGFAFFLMELVWYRMLGPLLGGTIFSFGLILAVALLGIGLGGALHGWMEARGRVPATLAGFAATCLLEAIALAIPFAIGDGVAILSLLLRPLGGALGFGGYVAGWAVVAGIVVLPAAFVSGIQFPVLIALLGRGRDGVGRQTGLAYTFNTAGGMAGSLAGGFGLLPLLSAPGCWRLVVALLAGLGLFAALMEFRRRGPGTGGVFQLTGFLAGGLCIALLLGATGPTSVWRHGPIAAGRVQPDVTASRASLRDWEQSLRRSIERDWDGVESAVALQRATGYAFVINGKSDGHVRNDAGTQVMGGLLGALLHPHPRRAFVVGLGTGSTSGWLAAIPSMQSVVTAELEPVVLDIARMCAAANHDALTNPKLQVALGDAREMLLTRGESYDIIISEPSNPYRAGIASLFTREYYQAIERRLAEGGMFLQWVQAYSIDGQTVRTIVATLASVFPHIEIWFLEPSDMLFVSTRQPLIKDVERVRTRMAEEPFRSALLQAWGTTSVEGFFSHHGARADFSRALASGEGMRLNTDDQSRVEFGFARAMVSSATVNERDLMALMRRRQQHRPDVVGGSLDVVRMDDAMAAFMASHGMNSLSYDGLSTNQRAWRRSLDQYVAGEYEAALATWRASPREPLEPFELAMVSDLLAQAGDEAAEAYIGKLRALMPVVSDGILARLRWRRGDHEGAARALVACFHGYRADPWPPPFLMRRALELAVAIAQAAPRAIPLLFEAVSEPFSLRMLDERRLQTGLALVRLSPGPACVPALAAFEPYVPWRQDFLTFRSRCYQTALHPLAKQAERDRAEYERDNPPAFP